MSLTISGRYVVIRALGDGASAEVLEALDLNSSEKVALKVLSKTGPTEKSSQKFLSEVQAMRTISHCNVLKMIDAHDDLEMLSRNGMKLRHHVMSLELCEQGDLLNFICKNGVPSEKQGLKYMHQLLSGVQAMHRAGICHRDLKPENILIDSNYNLKISDFGYAAAFDPSHQNPTFRTDCGTRQYMAPEVLTAGGYSKYEGKKADVWSAGIVCFILAVGHPPFYAALSSDWWFHHVQKLKYRIFWSSHMKKISHSVSTETQDMINLMLVSNPMNRANADSILCSPFFDQELETVNQSDKLDCFSKERSMSDFDIDDLFVY